MLRMKSLLIFLFLSCYQLCLGQNKKLTVAVDERMELLRTVELLSSSPGTPCANTDYKRSVQLHFSKYKTHPVIPFIGAMLNSETYNSSSLVWYLYQCSFPDLQLLGKILEEDCQIENYQQHLDTLAQFRKLLKDFYSQSHFHQFFISNKNLYDSICMPMVKYLSQFKIIDTIEQQYGSKKIGYHIILSPLVHPGGFGIQVHKKNGDEIYGIAGPVFDSKTLPIFPPQLVFKNIIIHEFSHSFCNSIIHKNFALLNRDSCLADTITAMNEHMKLYYGGDWETCLFEHLVRANEVVITKKVLGAEKSDNAYNEYYNDGKWILLKGLVPLIENEYLNNRKKYKTEEDLVQKIMEYLDEEKMKYCSQ